MKKRICIFAIVAALALGALIVRAQNGTPATYRLNAEASKAFVEAGKQQDELRRQYQQLEGIKVWLLIGAGFPPDSKCEAQSDGIVVCAKPKPSPIPPK